MTDPYSPRVLRLLLIVAVILLSAVFGPRVLGQDVPFRAPASRRPWDGRSTAGAGSAPACQGPSAPDSWCAASEECGRVLRVDYWIVSSRRCPQGNSCCPVCRRCQLDYFYFDEGPCGRFHDREAFLGWLRPGVPVCILVHGSSLSWKTIVEESEHMYRWIRGAAPERPLQVIIFSWPTDENINLLFAHFQIAALGQRSAFHGFYLAQLISELPPESPVSLFGHSHGARTVAAALHLRAGGSVQRRRLNCEMTEPRNIRVVFSAAALDHHWFNPGERYARALWQTEGLLNLRNRNDLALSLYPLRKPFSNRALGRAGFQRKDLRLLGPWGARVSQLDVTPLIGRGHGWAHYYVRPELARLFVPYLFFPDRNVPREKTFESAAHTQSANRASGKPVRDSSSTVENAPRKTDRHR